MSQIELPKRFNGWEPIDFRFPKNGECFISSSSFSLLYALKDMNQPRLIVKYKEPLAWRWATKNDSWIDSRGCHYAGEPTDYCVFVIQTKTFEELVIDIVKKALKRGDL